jgi:hypothetical protein
MPPRMRRTRAARVFGERGPALHHQAHRLPPKLARPERFVVERKESGRRFAGLEGRRIGQRVQVKTPEECEIRCAPCRCRSPRNGGRLPRQPCPDLGDQPNDGKETPAVLVLGMVGYGWNVER